MANEYRISFAGVETLHGGDSDARIYQASVTVLHGDQGDLPNARVYQISAQVLHSDQSSLPNARIYGGAVEVLTSTIQLVSPTFIDGATDPEVFPIESVNLLSPPIIDIPDRERNPYPSAYPAVDLDEQQRTIREQHNATQAGDSTFDFGLLFRVSPEQQFTLGSLGKFYHDDYGMIHARYVQFSKWVQGGFQGAPVGRFATSESVDWVVTNDFGKSGPDLAVGIAFPSVTPAEGYYGWAVVDGASIAWIQPGSEIVPAPDTPYTWAATGVLQIGVVGKTLARRWGHAEDAALPPGSLYVKTESFSPASIIELISQQTEELVEQVEGLTTRLTTAEDQISTLTGATNTLAANTESLQRALDVESRARVRDIQSVRLLSAGQDWSTAIRQSLNTARDEFRSADEELRVRIAEVRYTADEALAAAGGSDVALTEQVNSLTNIVAGFSARFINFTVDYPSPTGGEILISTVTTNSDGGLVTIFEPIDFVLENLLDVDVTTTPPSNGDVLTWDSGIGKWVPDAPSGGGGGGGGSSIAVEDEGTLISSAATKLNFVGTGVTVTDAGGGEMTVSIPGLGGAGVVPTLVQSKKIARSSMTGGLTLDAAPATGNMLVAIVFPSTASAPPSAASGWFEVERNTNLPDHGIFYRFAGIGESATQTPTADTGGGVIVILEFSGAVGVNGAGVQASTQTTDTPALAFSSSNYRMLDACSGLGIGYSGRRTEEIGVMTGSFGTTLEAIAGNAATVGGTGVSLVVGVHTKVPGTALPTSSCTWPTSAASKIGYILAF